MKKNATTPPPAPKTVTVRANAQENQKTALQKIADAQNAATEARKIARATGKPTLNRQNIESYLDWVLTLVVAEHMTPAEAQIMMRAVELVISDKHAGAQGKATQHGDAIE